ncbi:MAG: IS256 family transposase [Fibrobacterales bacterium]
MAIRKELINEIMESYQNPEDLMGNGGIFEQLQKRLIEAAMEGELSNHLGYDKNDPSGNNSGNSRNGASTKKIKLKDKELEISVPRDRNGEFESTLIPKHSRRFDGFDEKVIALYARGMSTREIQGYLQELYKIEVSPDLISTVTDTILDDVKVWQNRMLDSFYPIVFMDALRVKIRENNRIINKAVYIALAINMEGQKEVLGLWIANNEGAKFWLNVLTEIQNRGVQDILVACVDGLKGFPEAIESIYPETEVQLCIVHLMRASMKYLSKEDRPSVLADLKQIYTATTLEGATKALEYFSETWAKAYPTVYRTWKNNWEHIVPFLDYPPEIRRVIYTTNAIESLNYSLRKTLKVRSSFPNDTAALKLLYLGLERISQKWNAPFAHWGRVVQQLMIRFGDRFPVE